MTRLFGILIEENKELWLCLSDIPGVSKKLAISVCKNLGLFHKAPWKKITDKQRRSIYNQLMKNIVQSSEAKVLGTDLKRTMKVKKENLISLGNQRGIRLRQGLPVRGQSSHSNGKTARKKL